MPPRVRVKGQNLVRSIDLRHQQTQCGTDELGEPIHRPTEVAHGETVLESAALTSLLHESAPLAAEQVLLILRGTAAGRARTLILVTRIAIAVVSIGVVTDPHLTVNLLKHLRDDLVRIDRARALHRDLAARGLREEVHEVLAALIAVFIARVTEHSCRNALSLLLRRDLVEEGATMNVEIATRNLLRRNVLPVAAAHLHLRGVQTTVEAGHELAVRLETLAQLGDLREEALGHLLRQLRVLILARRPLSTEANGLALRSRYVSLQRIARDVENRVARCLGQLRVLREHKEVTPTAIVGQQTEHLLVDQVRMEGLQMLEHLLGEVALSLAAAHVARLEGQDEGVLKRLLRAHGENAVQARLNALCIQPTDQRGGEVHARIPSRGVDITTLHADCLDCVHLACVDSCLVGVHAQSSTC